MSGRPPIPTRTDTLLPYPTLFRSAVCHRFTRDELAIEPGRARCRHLIGKRQVRTSGERQTAIASRIIPRSQFDDRAWLRVAGHVQVIEADMVGSPIGTIDHGIGGGGELIEFGRTPVCTTVTNAHCLCSLLRTKQK